MPDPLDQDFFVSKRESDVESMAFIHALRANADGMKRLGDQLDRQSGKLDRVGDLVHDIDKRLAVIEENSLSSKVSDIEERVHKLEDSEQRRLGAVGLFEWAGKSWPAVVGFISLVVYVIIDKANLL